MDSIVAYRQDRLKVPRPDAYELLVEMDRAHKRAG